MCNKSDFLGLGLIAQKGILLIYLSHLFTECDTFHCKVFFRAKFLYEPVLRSRTQLVSKGCILFFYFGVKLNNTDAQNISYEAKYLFKVLKLCFLCALTAPLYIRRNTQKSKFLLSKAFKWKKICFL